MTFKKNKTFKGGLIRFFSFTGGQIFLSTVSFQHLIRVYSCEMSVTFFNLQSWKPDFWQKLFLPEIHFTNQRSNLCWKWRKYLMWGEHERRMNENLKNTYEKKIRVARQKTRKLWKWMVIGGNFFIISRILTYIIVFNYKFKERI